MRTEPSSSEKEPEFISFFRHSSDCITGCYKFDVSPCRKVIFTKKCLSRKVIIMPTLNKMRHQKWLCTRVASGVQNYSTSCNFAKCVCRQPHHEHTPCHVSIATHLCIQWSFFHQHWDVQCLLAAWLPRHCHQRRWVMFVLVPAWGDIHACFLHQVMSRSKVMNKPSGDHEAKGFGQQQQWSWHETFSEATVK